MDPPLLKILLGIDRFFIHEKKIHRAHADYVRLLRVFNNMKENTMELMHFV